MLSGIGHYYYCKRHWALIHIEQQWVENKYTAEGRLLHERADNPYLKEKRKDKFYSRAMPVSSKYLGLSGILDVVEFNKDPDGIEVAGKEGAWLPRIVEFKRGKKKHDNSNIIQLVAQVICLEESFNINIPVSYMYYHATNHKDKVEINQDLRDLAKKLADEMHTWFYNKNDSMPLTCTCEKGTSLMGISLINNIKKYSNHEEYFKRNMVD